MVDYNLINSLGNMDEDVDAAVWPHWAKPVTM